MWHQCTLILALVASTAFAVRPMVSIDANIFSPPSVESGSPAVFSCVFGVGGQPSVVPGLDPNAVAWGSIDTSVNTTGWYTLSLTTSESASGEQQMRCAGFLEGYLTVDSIWLSWLSWQAFIYYPDANVSAFLASNLAFAQSQSQTLRVVEPFWNQVAMMLEQLSGIEQAYNQYAPADQQLSLLQLWWLNAAGDTIEISQKFQSLQFEKMSAKELREHWQQSIRRAPHCSGLIKLKPDFSELYFGHATWVGFMGMLRVFKFYNFNLPGVAAKRVAFSSYPAKIASVDDYYITSQRLAVTETTNGIFSSALLAQITPEGGLPAWIRAQVANRLASSAPEWMKAFSTANGGTYNNQWMVVDYKHFTPGQPLPPNTFWVLEQMPGATYQADMTSSLALGYWGSYNIPYFPQVFNISGFNTMVEKVGVDYTYQLAPRAKIFRRDQSQVQSLENFQSMLRYNNWQNDPFSEGDPGNQVASRFDLSITDTDPFGAIDCKVTSSQLISDLSTWAQSGPTHDDQPVFSWAAFPSTPHFGQPAAFDFDFVLMNGLEN